jgi:anti-sigma regulatory factor (Ser/Thr protein kinase)
VFFYDVASEMAIAVADYVDGGLSVGQPAIVLATAPHLADIDAALSNKGVDVSLARARGSYLALDAAETLDAFMVHGSPNADRFVRVVGGMLDAVRVDGVPVRAFGEMVALLWHQGNVAGAMALESSWNDLAEHQRFSLLCAYPTTALGTAELTDVNQVCHLHSGVLPPTSYGSASTGGVGGPSPRASRVFVAAPEAVCAARHFVTETLTSWGENQLGWDGALIISELATNAIIHGGSAFRASIERSAGIVRIAIEDVGPGLPQSRRAFDHALGGRGLAIVEELSDRWGCDRVGGGKTFWVELETT